MRWLLHFVLRKANACGIMYGDACHRPVRSANNRTCLDKRSRNQFGDRYFATASSTLWNRLPEQLRRATGHHLGTIQAIVENVYVWLVGPRRPVSER